MKFASTVRSLTKKLADTVESTRVARSDIADVRANIAALQRQVLDVSDLPLQRADVSARILVVVKTEGDHWISQYGNALIYGENALAAMKAATGGVQLPGHLMTWGALCAASPDRAVEMLEALVARMTYQPGLSLAERPAALERLTRELQQLEADEEAAIDEMRAGGVAIEHRPEVTERRQVAARVKDLNEQQAVNRRQRQAAIDNRPRTRTVDLDVNRRTGGESQYLKTGHL